LLNQFLGGPGEPGFVKITIFGLTITSSWGNGHATPYRAILRALHRMGHEIHFFEKDVPYYSARRDFDDCDYCKITLYSDWQQVRKQALNQARESDVVLTASYLPEGSRINDEILEQTRPLHVFYDLDTPVTLNALAHGPVDYLRADQLTAFDLVLSFTGGPIMAELEQKYGVRAARPLFGCVDPDDYRRGPTSARFTCDLSYMGTYAEDRQAKVDELFLEPARRLPDKQFVLAGALYPWAWQWPENVRRIEHVFPHDHPKFYASSRVTLNITRAEMARWGWCPSGRFFEAAACSTPLVTDAWPGLDSFFDTEREVSVVASASDVEQALARPAGELEEMAARARKRTLEEHTGAVRARQLVAYLEEARTQSGPKSTGRRAVDHPINKREAHEVAR
jgi:spore maturation protein CgeB